MVSPKRSRGQCALARVIRLRFLIGIFVAYPRSLTKCDRTVRGRAALISEAEQSVTLAGLYHPLWRPGMHLTATSKITLCRPMRNLQAGASRQTLEGIAGIDHPPPATIAGSARSLASLSRCPWTHPTRGPARSHVALVP